MNSHGELIALYKAINEVQKVVVNATKSSKNEHFKNKYASLEDVINELRPVFSEHGLIVMQSPEFVDGNLVLTTRDAHIGGAHIETSFKLKVEKDTMQGYGSSITYARRYVLASLFCIGQEDDDGNKACEKPRDENLINPTQLAELEKALLGNEDLRSKMLLHAGVKTLTALPAAAFDTYLDRALKAKNAITT